MKSDKHCDKPVKVVVVHPDLGVGGAERLIVDLSKALQESKNHNFDVGLYTGYHDSSRCFGETRDGSLKVYSMGEWIPRHFFRRFHALMAYLKMLYIAIYLLLFEDFDVLICDQVPICLPILKLKPKRIRGRQRHYIFYCHFPDQLLTTTKTRLKTIYRAIINWVEERSIKTADAVLVNSEFTKKVFLTTFKSWKNSLGSSQPKVLYPCVDVDKFSSFKPSKKAMQKFQCLTETSDFVFLSLNRFERKKDLGLAIRAFSKFLKEYNQVILGSGKENLSNNPHLVVAGGYDERLSECVDYHNELAALVELLDLKDHVTFVKTPNDEEKLVLLSLCQVVIYTPQNEHFGIVPLEAMAMSKPVIATASGGPIETVCINEVNRTGHLCDPGNDESFCRAMVELAVDNSGRKKMGEAGFKRVMERFSYQVFQQQLEQMCS